MSSKIPRQSKNPPISKYEKEREKNIKTNNELLRKLQLTNLSDQFEQANGTPKAKSAVKKPIRHQPYTTDQSPRRSLRIQLKEATVNGAQLTQSEKWKFESELASSLEKLQAVKLKDWPEKRPEGQLECADYLVLSKHSEVENSIEDCNNFFSSTGNDLPSTSADLWDCNYDEQLAEISELQLTEERRFKIATERLYSTAIHPFCTDKLLVAAGDKRGQLGVALIDPKSRTNFVYDSALFSPHNSAINCLSFPHFAPNKLFSASYDGTIRCLDLEKQVFDEVYRLEDERNLCKYFDFASPNVMLAALHDADLAVVDLREKMKSCEYELFGVQNLLRTVSVHPLQPNLFAVAGNAGTVDVFDLRALGSKEKFQRSIYSLGESKTITSAFFSPLTGNRMVTCSNANRITVYDLEQLPKTNKLLNMSHNNQVGRWLTNFRPIWHPKSEKLIISGSMNQPRVVEVISVAQRNVVHYLDGLSSVCSINAVHPNMAAVCGVNSSGYAHIWC